MRASGGMAAATFLVVAATTLAGCSASGSDKEDTAAVSPREYSSDVPPLLEALDLLDPSRTVGIDFTSDRQSADRLGLLAEDAASWGELAEQFDSALAAVPPTEYPAVGLLAEDVRLMAEGDAAFSQLDVRWSLVATSGVDDQQRAQVRVFRLVDGLDMADVTQDFEDAGYEGTSADNGWTTFHLGGQLSDHVDITEGSQVEGRFPQEFFPDVHVNPDAHLVALGDLATLRRPDESASIEDQVGALMPPDPQAVEFFLATTSAYANCYAPVDKATNFRASPRAIRSWEQRFDISALGRPGVTTLWGVPGEDVVHRSYFADEATARAAFAARTRIFNGSALADEAAVGVLMPKDGNVSPYEPGWRMSRSRNVIEVLHNPHDPEEAVYTYRFRGLGFDACGAPGMFS